MLNIAICDNDEISCAQLEKFLLCFGEEYKESIEVDVFYHGATLIRSLDSGVLFDIIFLEIELESMTGIEIGHNIRNNRDDNETHEFYSRMIDVAKQLSTHDFVEIHKSYLIHYDHVMESGYDYVIMTNNQKLPISQNHRKSFRNWVQKRKDQKQ